MCSALLRVVVAVDLENVVEINLRKAAEFIDIFSQVIPTFMGIAEIFFLNKHEK